MPEVIPVGIAGLGYYVPEKRLTNHDLERMVDTSDEWIVQRTGIRERRIAAPDEYASTMGIRAARAALEDAGIDGSEVDLVLCCTVTGDQPFPATACTLGAEIGAVNAGGWDISAACSGFVFGLQTASQFVATGQYKTVVVVGVEKLSSILDYTDRNTCVLFGDGAGAAVVTSLERAGQGEIVSHSVGMHGHSEDVLAVPAGGSRCPTSHDTIEQRLHYMKMGGSKVYRFAVKIFAELVEKSMAPYGMDQLGLVVPHQVNQRIIENAAERVGVSMDRVFVNIDKYGNTSAASVPIALSEARDAGRFEKGKFICVIAFGAGMAWGHTLIRW
jgi:3-oxoacyl-[acyl-carrier-protein] synthase-3